MSDYLSCDKCGFRGWIPNDLHICLWDPGPEPGPWQWRGCTMYRKPRDECTREYHYENRGWYYGKASIPGRHLCTAQEAE